MLVDEILNVAKVLHRFGPRVFAVRSPENIAVGVWHGSTDNQKSREHQIVFDVTRAHLRAKLMTTWDHLPDDLIKAIMSWRCRLMLQDAMARCNGKMQQKEREEKMAWAEYDRVLMKACGRDLES
jgi:hypothetical protein